MSKTNSYTFEVSETKTGVAVKRHKDGTIHITVYVTQDEMNRMIDTMANEVLDESGRDAAHN